MQRLQEMVKLHLHGAERYCSSSSWQPAGWLWVCLPNPVGMSLVVNRKNWHPRSTRLQKTLPCRFRRQMYPSNVKCYVKLKINQFVCLCVTPVGTPNGSVIIVSWVRDEHKQDIIILIHRVCYNNFQVCCVLYISTKIFC